MTVPMESTTPNQGPAPNSILGQEHPLQLLPLDVLLLIIDRLTPVEYTSFAFAAYPMLLEHNLVPRITRAEFVLFTHQVRSSNSRPAPATNNSTAAQTPGNLAALQIRRAFPVPTELLVQIMSNLCPMDKINFILANYADLKDAGIAPTITLATLGALRGAVGKKTVKGMAHNA